jgi:DNA-binding CsgD family transcriptional regulator
MTSIRPVHSTRTARTNLSAWALILGAWERSAVLPFRWSEDGVECGGELRVPVADQVSEAASGFLEIGGEVAGEPGGPLAGRVPYDPEQVHPSCLVFDGERDAQAGERDRAAGVEEICGEQRAGVSAEDLADGGGGCLVSEPAQLALDPDYAPPRVLPGQADDQLDEFVRYGRAARSPWAGATCPPPGGGATFDLDEYVFEALRAGASGFALKSRPPEELLSGIRTVADGEALLAPSVTRRLIAHFADRTRATAKTPWGLDELTDREREVLALVARGQSNAELAATLHVTLPTAKTHVSRLLTKLGARDRTQLAILAYESGIATR